MGDTPRPARPLRKTEENEAALLAAEPKNRRHRRARPQSRQNSRLRNDRAQQRARHDLSAGVDDHRSRRERVIGHANQLRAKLDFPAHVENLQLSAADGAGEDAIGPLHRVPPQSLGKLVQETFEKAAVIGTAAVKKGTHSQGGVEANFLALVRLPAAAMIAAAVAVMPARIFTIAAVMVAVVAVSAIVVAAIPAIVVAAMPAIVVVIMAIAIARAVVVMVAVMLLGAVLVTTVLIAVRAGVVATVLIAVRAVLAGAVVVVLI